MERFLRKWNMHLYRNGHFHRQLMVSNMLETCSVFNPIQDGLFRGCSRMGGLFAHPPP